MRTKLRKPGATLIEILTYMALASVVFLAIYGIFAAGRRYFEIARASIEVQQAANTIAFRLGRDLAETEPNSVQSFPNSSATSAPVGVVFLSARKVATGAADDNVFQVDPTYGIPKWQKYVGYYLDADPSYPDNPRMMALYMAEYVPSGFPKTRADKPLTNNVTTATIRTSGVNRRLVAHGVLAPTTTRPRGGFNCYAMVNGAQSQLVFQNPLRVDLELVNTSAGVARSGGETSNDNSITTQMRVEGRS